MFSRLFSKKSDRSGATAHWPAQKMVDFLKRQYADFQLLDEQGELQVYGVTEKGINFGVVLVHDAPSSGRVIEFGFITKFTSVDLSQSQIEHLNRSLHISFAQFEDGELYLMCALQVAGEYSDQFFGQILDGWRRDLAVTLMQLTGDDASFADVFPATRMKAAMNFATNQVPQTENGPRASDMLSAFMGADAGSMTECSECDGRGKRGLIARMCDACDGQGFVKGRRR